MQPGPVNYKRHIGSLDGLRGVAIAVVFLHHYYPRPPQGPLAAVASLGWVGVDLFFVLSGFLITGILFDTLHTPKTLKNFFARRALRLFPVYLLLVGLVLVFAKPLQVPLSWRDIPFFAYAANWVDAFGVRPTFGPYLRFDHLWSLAVEEQFYLLWAPVVFLLKGRRRIMVACAVGVITAAVLRAVGVGHVGPLVLYENLFTRMDSILCGAAFALAIRGESAALWLNKKVLWVFVAVGLGVLAYACLVSHSLFDQRAPMLRVGYLGNDLWCVGVLGLALIENSVNRALNSPALRFVGRYSYGLYLWHEAPRPLLEMLQRRIEQASGPLWLSRPLACAVLFALCLGVAIVSFHVIELPCLRLKRFFVYEDPQGTPREEPSIDLEPAEASLGDPARAA